MPSLPSPFSSCNPVPHAVLVCTLSPSFIARSARDGSGCVYPDVGVVFNLLAHCLNMLGDSWGVWVLSRAFQELPEIVPGHVVLDCI
eukprot:2098683-Pyramimonas_sp.AAC.1